MPNPALSVALLHAITDAGLEVRIWKCNGDLQIEFSGHYDEGKSPFAVDSKIQAVLDQHPEFEEGFEIMHTCADVNQRTRMNGFEPREVG